MIEGPSDHREGLRILAALLGVVYVPLAIAAIGQPLSTRGIAWTFVAGITISALALGSRRSARLAAAASVCWAGIVALTIAWPDRSTYLRAIELPSGEPSSRLGAVFSERDASVVGMRVMRAIGAITAHEIDGFREPLVAIYDEIEARDGEVTVTPFVPTVLGHQDRDGFDALVHEEPGSDRWVVFLHGSAGLFASYCWVVVRAAADAGWSTICPATGFAGQWAEGDGPAIVDRAIDHALARGARHVVLAGLSNRGIGASLMASELEDRIEALVLISGVSSLATPIDRPTLIWHSAGDERIRVARARDYASRAPDATLVEVDGDHFALVEQRAELARAITAFLAGLR